jgi:hypothetical protein
MLLGNILNLPRICGIKFQIPNQQGKSHQNQSSPGRPREIGLQLQESFPMIIPQLRSKRWHHHLVRAGQTAQEAWRNIFGTLCRHNTPRPLDRIPEDLYRHPIAENRWSFPDSQLLRIDLVYRLRQRL